MFSANARTRQTTKRNVQLCFHRGAGAGEAPVATGAKDGGSIALFGNTSGTSIQDSGVNIAPFLSGVWIDLPTSGPSAIGTGGIGSNPLVGYVNANGNYFSDAAAGEFTLRDSVGKTVRIGINNAANNPPSTIAVSSSQVTLNLGVKLTTTHGTSGSAATSGIATLSGGHVTVSTSSILALASSAGAGGDAIDLTLQSCSSCGILSIGTVVSGMSFVINSSSATDSSNVFWNIRHIN